MNLHRPPGLPALVAVRLKSGDDGIKINGNTVRGLLSTGQFILPPLPQSTLVGRNSLAPPSPEGLVYSTKPRERG
jgi:hypothetical protein